MLASPKGDLDSQSISRQLADYLLHFLVGWLAFDDGEDHEPETGLGVFFVGPWDRRDHYVHALAIDSDVHITKVGIEVFISPLVVLSNSLPLLPFNRGFACCI